MLCQASELSQPRGPCVEVALRLARNVALGGVSLQDWLLACSPCGCPVALSIPLCSALRLALRVDGAPVLMPRAPKCCRLRVSRQPGQHGDVICSAPRAARRRRWLRWSLRCGSRVVSVRPRDEFPHVRVVGQLAESVLSFANDHRGGRDHAGVGRSEAPRADRSTIDREDSRVKSRHVALTHFCAKRKVGEPICALAHFLRRSDTHNSTIIRVDSI